MFETLLRSAFESGGEVFVFMTGFSSPLRGRVQNIDGDYFTFFQSGKQGTVLWAFRLIDIISCGLIVGPPVEAIVLTDGLDDETEESLPFGADD